MFVDITTRPLQIRNNVARKRFLVVSDLSVQFARIFINVKSLLRQSRRTHDYCTRLLLLFDGVFSGRFRYALRTKTIATTVDLQFVRDVASDTIKRIFRHAILVVVVANVRQR